METNDEQLIDSVLVLYTLGEGNPGAYTVVSKLYKCIEEDENKSNTVMEFIKNVLMRNITGARLWYIYKNEAAFDINSLLQLDLTKFNDTYFYDKFEKYI